MRNIGKYMDDRENLRFIPTNIWDSHCFGCSPVNPAGLQMKFYTDEKSIYSWLKVPDHLCGWNRLVHGGVISTILDEVMGWAAIHLLKVIVLTKTMTVDYIQPVFMDDELEAKGWITKFDNDGEVIMWREDFPDYGYTIEGGMTIAWDRNPLNDAWARMKGEASGMLTEDFNSDEWIVEKKIW